MVNLIQHMHSPCDVGKLTGHKKNRFDQGTLISLFCALYVDDGAFTFEYLNQLTRGLTPICHHCTRFCLEMQVCKGKKASKTECVFFPSPGFFGRKFNLPTKNSRENRRILVPKTSQESYEARHRREEIAYDNLPETRLVVVKDVFVTFF